MPAAAAAADSASHRRQREDGALMARAQRGDREAFAVFYGRYRVPIRVWLLAHLPRPWDEIEDAEATVWARAWLKRHLYHPPASGDPLDGNPRAWVYAIARNYVIDLVRAISRRTLVSLADDEPRAAEDRAAAEEDRLLVAADVRRAVADLTPEQAQAVALRWLADLSIEETARLVGCAPDAVKQRQVRAFRRLRKQLASYAPDSRPAAPAPKERAA